MCSCSERMKSRTSARVLSFVPSLTRPAEQALPTSPLPSLPWRYVTGGRYLLRDHASAGLSCSKRELDDRAPNRGALYGYANITLIDTGEKPIPPRSSGAWSGGREAPASMRLSRWLALVCAKLLTPRDQFAWGPIENGLQACSSLIASRSNSELNYFSQATQVHRQRLGIFPVPALDRHAVLELLTALGEPR